MKIEIEIPEEFVVDYNRDLFKDFFTRVIVDIDCKGACGNYEREIAEMFVKAFDESKSAYDVDKVVEELEDEKQFWNDAHFNQDISREKSRSYEHAIEIVKAGVVNNE